LDPENVGILLRLSKLYSDLVEESKGPASEQMARRSLQYAEKAVKLDGHNAKAHLSVAVSYGKLTNFVGNREKVDYSKIVREEVDKSLALDPSDSFGWHVLGRWHVGVANVGPVLRALAKVAYGGLPAASNGEAARSFEKAVELAPDRIIHHAELARVYRMMGKLDLARKEWRTIIASSGTSPEDEREKKAARTALASLAGPVKSE
jgi:tetratricopeptide (TPR) repeat protein